MKQSLIYKNSSIMSTLFKRMNLIRTCLLAVFFLALSFSSRASHLAAADIFVDYAGGMNYKVTLVVYRSCEATSKELETEMDIEWWSPSCQPAHTTVTMTKPVIDTVDQLCDTFKLSNQCRDVTKVNLPGYVRHTWEKIVTLPKVCKDWTFMWTLGARNAAILNLAAPDSRNLCVYTMINNVIRLNIQSPRFSVDPIPYYCVNSLCTVNNGPYDPDRDSLFTINNQPMNGYEDPIPYTDDGSGTPPGTYSLVEPIYSIPSVPYTVDPTTGAGVFNCPVGGGKYALAYRVNKYDVKTKELIAYTIRDAQIYVSSCYAPAPDGDTLPENVAGSYLDVKNKTIYACPDMEMRFDFGATSKSLLNAIFAKWDVSKLSGATFASSGDGTKRAVGTLVWKPTRADVGDHIVSLRFVDSTCSLGNPLVSETYYTVRIKVLPYVQAGKDGIYCLPGGSAWTMQTVNEPNMRYKWSSIAGSPTTPPPFMDNDTLANPSVRPAVNSTYMVVGTVIYGPYRCSSRDTVNVRMGKPVITVNAGPNDTICANTPVVLKGSATPAAMVSTIKWSSTGTISNPDILSPTVRPSISTNYVLYGQDVNGCGFTDTTRVVVDGFTPLLAPFASRDTVCPEGFTQLFANVSQQACGIAQSSCSGGVPEDKLVGTSDIASIAPTPFNTMTNTGGERMQILYRRNELLDAGLKAGFINSMAFNIAGKNSADSFYKFTIKMTCTGDDALKGSTMTSYPGVVEVLPAQTVGTVDGWNTLKFPNAYYWDGASNLMVEICWSKVYGISGGSADPVYTSNTPFISVKYIPSYTLSSTSMGDGCALATGTPLLASNRPNTRFNVCVTPSLFKYAWTPTTYLNAPDSANTNVNGIKDNTTYTVKVTATSNPDCFASGTVALKIDRTNSVVALPASPFIVCRNGYVQLDAEGKGPKPLGNYSCGITTAPCDTKDLISTVIANPGTALPKAEPSNHAFNGAYSTVHTQYIIPRSAMLNGKMTSGIIRRISIPTTSVTTQVFKNLKISFKCTDLEQFPDATVLAFETGTVPVYTAATKTMSLGYTDFDLAAATPYSWDTSKNLLVDICYSNDAVGTAPTINTYPTPGFKQMIRSYQTSGDICANPSTEIGPALFENLPIFRFSYCSAGEVDFSYNWTPGEFVKDSTVQKPTVYVGASTKLYVSTQGRNGCTVRDSVTIFVPTNKRSVTADKDICLNETTNLRSYNGLKTIWYEGPGYSKPSTLSCDECESTIASPKVATDYFAAVTDEYGCIDTFKVHIGVKTLPSIYTTNRDTTIKYGSSVELRAFGGTQYTWYPLSGISNPNLVNPIAKPLITTVYTVVGVGQNGCRGEDSVKITIDYKAPIGVPTGFTPNNDGVNDKFGLTGVSFQTLLEFRVFNRWGQEVFTTKDISSGWDGTFNGTPQDMGVYSYIIRVGYPDGYTEIYKGDVTLIR